MDRLPGIYEASNTEQSQQEDPLVSLDSQWGPWAQKDEAAVAFGKGLAVDSGRSWSWKEAL